MNHRIIVHDIDHARAALSAANERNVGVTLLSPPGAAAYIGAAVFQQIVATAAAEYPAVTVRAVLDCGDDPGHALNALRHGLKAIRVRVPPKVRKRLGDIAKRSGAVIDTNDGAALDLLAEADPVAACRVWLGIDGK